MANIASLLEAQLATPERALYRQFADGGWHDQTAADIAAAAARWQAAFRREGFAPGDRIAIGLRNGTGWVALDQAALGLGLVVVPLYADDRPDSQAYCAITAGARLVVVETDRMAAALAAAGVAATAILCARAENGSAVRAVESFLPPATDEFSVAPAADDALATICFTSGTAGRPKGVMLSHRNILANLEGCPATGMARPDDVFLSFLPLSHMFERTGGYYLPLAIGAKVAFSRGIAQLPEDLASERPTAMFAVPRVFERFAARIRDGVAGSPWKRGLLERCVVSGARVELGGATLVDRLATPVLRALVARPILDRFGGRLRLAVVGGAAMDPAIAGLFIGLGLPVLQGYGLTEASPVVSVNRLDDNDPETVGPALDNVEVRLGEAGELLVRGPSVMLGYWNDPAATARVLDGERWLHTGDVAEFERGHIAIRGRLKDILVLSNGEKLVVVGEGRPFLTLLAVAKDADEKELVKRANGRLAHFPRHVRVRRAIVSPEPWTVENGLLTPTLKVKRNDVLRQFAPQIEAVYAGGAAAD
jgi:long-chain acyl-CoA synthetase